MSDTGSQEPASGASGRIRLVGAVLLLVLAALTWLKAPWADRQQAAWFDAHQTLLPRAPERDGGVTVVAIDQKSLTAMGRWPGRATCWRSWSSASPAPSPRRSASTS